MIQSVTVTNYLGESIDMELKSPEKSGFLVYSIEGIGPGKADVNIKNSATFDGGIFNTSRLKIRDVKLTLRFVGNDIETVRQKSYKYFPIKRLVKLTFHTDNRDSYLIGYVEQNEPTIFSTKASQAGCKINITCADPYIYSIAEMTVFFSGIVPKFEFPFDNNSLTQKLIEMGEIVTKQYETVHYTGDIDTGVTITIHCIGTVGDIKVYNVTARQVVEISQDKLEAYTGSPMLINDTITICSVKGQKSVTLLRNGVVTNILNCLDKNADWFTVTKGDNIFAYTAEEGATNLQFKVTSRIVYEGV